MVPICPLSKRALPWPPEPHQARDLGVRGDTGACGARRGEVRGPPVVLLGNLPYGIAGRLLAALCSAESPFRRFGLMIQAEMADQVQRCSQGGQPNVSTDEPPRIDRRRYPRVPVRVEVAATDSGSAYAINMSKTGLCLQSAEQHAPGQRLRLRFRLCPSNEWVELEAEVVWCTQETDLAPGMTFYEVGVRFLAVPPREHELLVAFVDHGSVDDPNLDAPRPRICRALGGSGDPQIL